MECTKKYVNKSKTQNLFQMASMHWTLLTILIKVTLIIAAPSDINKLEDIPKIEKADAELETPLTLSNENSDNTDTTQGQRQKRFYNPYGYGFPPMNPVIYPNRDDQNGQYGYEDPIVQIQRRLQDIASIARTSNYNFNAPPPLPPTGHFPVLFPVIFIPYVNCRCTPNQTPNQTPNNPTQPPSVNNTIPDLTSRLPQLEDANQNWGLAINDTEQNDNQEDDFSRPISFVPILPSRPMNRPPPNVDHGSSQAGIGGTNNQASTTTTTTTVRPVTNPPRPMQNRPPSASLDPPSACDGAILSCCHQPQVTFECFALSGCPDPTSYGNPCDIAVIFRVINRFQTYYGSRG